MQSLQYKNLCKAVSRETREKQTKAVGKEHYMLGMKLHKAQLSEKIVNLSYCAVVL